MIRAIVFGALLAGVLATPAAAQTQPASPAAIQALAALWRPIAAESLGAAEAVSNACAGAAEESAAVETALPANLTPEAFARVRSLGGFIIVPADQAPGGAYFIPPPEMVWFTSGLGVILTVSESEGFFAARDAAGRDTAIQIGATGRRPTLRIRDPEGGIATFVGCMSLAGGEMGR